MPIVTIQFNLPEEQEEYEIHQNAWALRNTLRDLLEELLSAADYAGNEARRENAAKWRGRAFSLMQENGVTVEL